MKVYKTYSLKEWNEKKNGKPVNNSGILVKDDTKVENFIRAENQLKMIAKQFSGAAKETFLKYLQNHEN